MQGSFLETDDKIVNDSCMKESMPDVFYDKIAPRIKNGELEVDIDGLLAVVTSDGESIWYGTPIHNVRFVNPDARKGTLIDRHLEHNLEVVSESR